MTQVKSHRKVPTQKRAQKTVNKILKAAAEILKEQGADALTTNRIAARAKVNIASVYQYYPNKEVILDDLMSQAFELITKILGEKAIELSGLTMREGLQQGLRYVVDMYRDSESLLSALFDSQQNLLESKALEDFKNVLFAVGKVYIEKENKKISSQDAQCTLYVSYNSIVFVLASHLKGNDAGSFSDQQIINELTEMICLRIA